MQHLSVKQQLDSFCKRKYFNLESSHYLNGAYMSPLPIVTESAGIEGMRRKRIPVHLTKDHFFLHKKLVRERFSQLLHINSPKNIALIPSVSYGLSIIANNTPCTFKKDIIVVEDEFPSVYYTWKKYSERHSAHLKIAKRPKAIENRGTAWTDTILNLIDENTHIISIGNIHWQDGSLFDLKRIAEKAHCFEALLVIDATQSAGVIDINVNELKPYALLASSYKTLLGPYSMAVGYFSDALCLGEPLEENWINRHRSDNFSELTQYQDQYREGAERFDVGESSNFILMPMLAESLKLLLNWGVNDIQHYCQYLSNYLVEKLRPFNIQLINNSERGSHYLGISISQFDLSMLNKVLSDANVIVSVRGNFMRVSLHAFNNIEDCDALVDALQYVLLKQENNILVSA